jgi:hypothetical protein
MMQLHKRNAFWVGLTLLMIGSLACGALPIGGGEETAVVEVTPVVIGSEEQEPEAPPTVGQQEPEPEPIPELPELPPLPPILQDGEVLTNAVGGYDFVYPAGWEAMQLGPMAMLAESEEVLSNFDFNSGAAMMVLAGPTEETLITLGSEGQAATTEDLLAAALVDFEDESGSEMGEIETRRFAYEEGAGASLRWEEDGTALEGYLATYMRDNYAAVILAAAPEDQWPDVWPLVDAMLSTMIFYEAQPTADRGNLGMDETATANLELGGLDAWYYDSPGDEVISVMVTAIDNWDPTLEILDPNGMQIVFNDDYVGLDPGVEGLTLLTPGRYEFRVGAFSGSGPYEISLSFGTMLPTLPIRYGETVSGDLTDDEPRHAYTFEGTEGDIVTISTVGLGELDDTFLELFGPDGSLLEDDDDSGEGFFALIEDYMLEETGTHRIVVRGFWGAVGPYELTLTGQ